MAIAKVSAKLGSHLQLQDLFQVHAGCEQNLVPCNWKTEAGKET